MRAVAILVLLLTVCSIHAGLAGFELGNGVALTAGVVRVNYIANKSVSIAVAPGLRLRLMEVQLTFANGQIKRHTMLFAGTHTLRAPLPIDLVEILGCLCALGLVCGITALLGSVSRFGCAKPGAPPNGSPARPVDNSGARAGPPSVS